MPEEGGWKPLFFLSYAHSHAPDEPEPRGPSELMSKFFTDLSNNIRQLVYWRSDPGFIDRSMRGGDRWGDNLLHAVSTCQVFVALLSSSYPYSDWCGMEWDGFSQRQITHSPSARKFMSCILPIKWTGIRKSGLPPVVQAVQMFSPAISEDPKVAATAAAYELHGIYGLMQVDMKVYNIVTWCIAQQIAEIQASHLVDPLKLVESELRNVFKEEVGE